MPADLPADLDTSNTDTLRALLLRALAGGDKAIPLWKLVAPPRAAAPRPGVMSAPLRDEYDVKCAESVDTALKHLDKPSTRSRKNAADKALRLLRTSGPAHRSLQTHRYEDLDDHFGVPIWQSNIETAVPNAWRMWWFYGPDEGGITVAAVGPHPKKSIKAPPRVG